MTVFKTRMGQKVPAASRRGVNNRLAGSAAHFVRDEDGNMGVFALVMASLMIAFGGLAVDMMRYEATRASLQNTLDRAALAGAAFSQGLNPEAVVTDYFDKAGLAEQLVKVEATSGLNFRRVEAFAEADTYPFFLDMVGIETLHVEADSAAEQRITNVEVMLVLDVSGSMGNNNKLTNLKTAAKEFVDTVLKNDAEDKISIGLVPFNGQVNLGATVLAEFNATLPHGAADVNCVDLPAAVFEGTNISTTVALPMTADADTYSWSWDDGAYHTDYMTPYHLNKWCPPVPGNVVRLPKQDIGILQGEIDGLSAIGATSINAGMKWGLAMLDPSMVSTYETWMADDEMPDTLEDRPFDFTDDEAMKVIVLMTDGEHFAEERVSNDFKAGPSPIFRGTVDNLFSIFHQSQVLATNAATICASRPYWVPHLGQWHSRPWNGVAPPGADCYVEGAVTPDTARLTWPGVWSAMRMSYVVQQFYVRAVGGSTASWMDMFRTRTPVETMNTQLQEICTMARSEGVIVYGIAFEAPVNGQDQIRGCSTSDSHYFDAAGVQISTAFRAIANNISQLRLMQ